MDPFLPWNQSETQRRQTSQCQRTAAPPGVKHQLRHAHPTAEQASPSNYYLGVGQVTATPTNCTTASGGHVTTAAFPGGSNHLTPSNQWLKAESPMEELSEDASENTESLPGSSQARAQRSEKKARVKLGEAHDGVAKVLRENGRSTPSDARADNMNELVKFSREIVDEKHQLVNTNRQLVNTNRQLVNTNRQLFNTNHALRQRVMQLENLLDQCQQSVQGLGAFPQAQSGPLYHVTSYNNCQEFGPGPSGM